MHPKMLQKSMNLRLRKSEAETEKGIRNLRNLRAGIVVLGGSSMPRNAGADGNSLYTIQQRGLCQQGGQSVATYEEAMGYIYLEKSPVIN